jgi:hypothetical protein
VPRVACVCRRALAQEAGGENHMTFEDRVSILKRKAIDEFSMLALDGARHALADTANPLRFNFFSNALRILVEHMMQVLAPDKQITQSSWFAAEKVDGKPTRGQRIVFAIQGGLSDVFVKRFLQIDVAPLRKRLISAMDDLSKHVHGREDTVITDVTEQDEAARSALEALENFLTTYHECRFAIADPIQEQLSDATVEALLRETIQEIDELATHHSVEEVYVNETKVKAIGPHTITYHAKGSVFVELQYGSNSDVRRGDGALIQDFFPFECDIDVSLADPWNLSTADTSYTVDTSKWYEGRHDE